MADNDNDIKIKLTATDEASPTVKAAVESLTSSMQALNAVMLATAAAHQNTGNAAKDHGNKNTELAAGFFLLKEAATVVYEAFEKIEQQVEKAIDASLANEKATNQMKGALVATGQYTAQTSKEIQAYTAQVEKNTGAGAAQIKTMIAQGIQMGLTVEKSKEMEEAARKLAVANNTDVKTAFDTLRQSLQGHVRGLALVIPQVKEFGAAQLKQGAGIDLVNQLLTAQYSIYQGSLPAAIDRAKGSVERVYLAFGNIITQNPLAIKAVQMFTDVMGDLEKGIEALGEFISENQETIEEYLSAFGKAVVVIGAAIAVFTLATQGVALFGAAITLATGPLGLLTIAVVAITAILKEWPFVFDYIAAAAKAVFSGILSLVGMILDGYKELLGVFGKHIELLDQADAKIKQYAASMADSAVKSYDAGKASMDAGQKAVVAHTDAKKAAEEQLVATSKLNAEIQNTGKSYAGFNIGTLKQREALQAEAQDRDKALKDFTEYQNNKNRVAISAAEEQQMELTKFKSGVMKGAGGSEEADLASKAAIDAEKHKQLELSRMRKEGLLDEDQYEEAMLGSKQRAAEAEFDLDKSVAKKRADILGDSPEGFAQRQQIAEQHFQLELQEKIERAQSEEATDAEIASMKQDALAQHKEVMLGLEQKYNDDVAKRDQVTGATITATQKKYFQEQEKAETDRIKNFASGVTLMTGIQESYNKTTNALTDALIKNQKISASKMVGIFLESLGQKIAQDGFANILMGAAMTVLLNPQGPALIAAGGAEVAGGVAIGRLGSSMQGGQADEGQDSVPQPLSGKSFVVSGGERIVQPSANKDLTSFLQGQKNGDSNGGGTVVNITVQTTAGDMARDTVDALINELRRRSELGTPIINQKGVVS